MNEHKTDCKDPTKCSCLIDQMIEQASRPSPAELIKRAMAQGILKPVQEYNDG